jgi:hypothetical protein
MLRMVAIFGSMGFLEAQEGPEGDPVVPDKLLVASYGKDVEAPAAETVETREPALKARRPEAVSAARVDAAAALRESTPADATWSSPDEAADAPLPVRRPDR